jgi:hypothetical protein
MNENDEHNHILDAATPFRAGQPRLPEVLEGSGQYRPKAAAYIDKNSGITNGTVRIGDSCRGFEGPKLRLLGDDKTKGVTAVSGIRQKSKAPADTTRRPLRKANSRQDGRSMLRGYKGMTRPHIPE